MPALIVALIIALSGGTAAAASTSLPGDALYPVKVNVSEKVASAFRFSDEGKAEFKLRLAERRLEEAEKLAVEGKLDANIVSNIETHFDSQEQRMQEIIKRLEANGKVEAATRLSSNLEAMLNAHDEIIAKLNAKIEAGEELVAPEVVGGLHTLVKDRLEISKGLRAGQEAKFKSEFKAEAAANVKAMAQHKIDLANSFIAEAEAGGKVSAEAIAEAKVKVGEAVALMAEGNAKLEAGANAEAFEKFMAAQRKALEAHKVLRAHVNLDIEMHRSGGMMKNRIESDTELKVNGDNDNDDDTKVEIESDTKAEVNLSL